MDSLQFGPWTLTQAEAARLDAYAKLQDLIAGGAAKWDRLYARDKAEAGATAHLPQMWVNLPGLVARAAADLILPEPPRLTANPKSQTPNPNEVQTRLDALAKRSRLHSLAWRAVYWTAALGDSFLVIADVAAENPKSQTPSPKTEPVLTLRRAVDSVARAIRTEDPRTARKFIFRSIVPGGVELFSEYAAGEIRWAAYRGGKRVPLPDGYVERIETREDVPLCVHFAALRGDPTDEAFGESDFAGCEDLAFEISNRLRQVSRILDRHAEPPMNVPDGMIDETGALDVRNKKVFERGVTGQGAEYITWQSQLDQAYAEVDRLADLILLLTETPPALWGRDRQGMAESGRALKFRLLSGLGKARRTGGALREALAEAARLALRREDILAGRAPGDYEIEAGLPDTFIADEIETADWVEKLRRAGAMSVRRAAELAQGLSGAELDAEVREIEGRKA